jgi:outer membrane protein, multidrug efflux system
MSSRREGPGSMSQAPAKPPRGRPAVPGTWILRPGTLLVGLLGACTTVGPDYHEPRTSVSADFGELSADGGAATSAPPIAAWWTTFHDATLDALIERAIRANPDLRAAQARVREARAQRGIAAADEYPTVDVVGGGSRARTSGHVGDAPARTSNLFQAGFDAAWEIDVFGGVRRAVEAADADVAASVEDRRDVLVSLLAEVARDYVDLRGAQRQASIARANLATQRETLELTRTRLEGGLATDLDVARAEAQVETTASTIPTLESAARLSIHALSVLLAEEPNALVDELSVETALPAPPPDVPVGIPSDLLRRRPDVRRAERRLAAATARIGVATAEYFPRFSLTGALGHASDGLGRFLDADSRTVSLGGAVRWRVLDFGRIAGNVEVANAREEQAAAVYETTVLASLRDVEDALTLLAEERSRRTSLVAAETASRRAADLAGRLWTGGRTDFLAVLQAQRDLFSAQDALVQSDRRSSEDLVALYKALGGGWEIEERASDGPPRGEPGARVLDISSTKPATKE